MAEDTFRVRVLPGRALSLDRYVAAGEETDLPCKQAVSLARDGVVVIVLEPGVVKQETRPSEPPERPQKPSGSRRSRKRAA
jgi:hypothetical protein